MVHALEEARRVLKRGGSLIDLGPGARNRQVELELGGATLRLGEIDSSRSLPDHFAADEALQAACERGLLRLEHQARFETVTDLDSAADFREYAASLRRSIAPDELGQRVETMTADAEGDCLIRARREMTIARYRRL